MNISTIKLCKQVFSRESIKILLTNKLKPLKKVTAFKEKEVFRKNPNKILTFKTCSLSKVNDRCYINYYYKQFKITDG